MYGEVFRYKNSGKTDHSHTRITVAKTAENEHTLTGSRFKADAEKERIRVQDEEYSRQTD